MSTYEFSIIASGLDPEAPDFETRFFDAGCDDATISFQKGHIIADFARQAESFETAVCSAIEAVHAAGAVVNRVEPDPLVSLSDIASRTGMSRAAMTQYSKGQRGRNFPTPVAKVTSDSPLWDWAVVAHWFYARHQVTRETVVEAVTVKAVNEVIGRGGPDIAAQVHQRVQEYVSAL